MFFGANALESPHLDQGKQRSNPSSDYYSGMMLMQTEFFFGAHDRIRFCYYFASSLVSIRATFICPTPNKKGINFQIHYYNGS